MKTLTAHKITKTIVKAFIILTPFIAVQAFAAAATGGGGATGASTQSLSTVASNLTGNFGALAKMITAAAYVAGFGFAFAAILKFKAHKDNPQQIPVGTPIALMFVGAALIFLPTLFSVSGQSVFGSGASTGGSSGTDSVPGFSAQQSGGGGGS